jgi:radical SAM superfamily enzyme YgiQ (UPF0313 family)
MNLSNIQKPQRYVGNEWNVVKKSHDHRVKVCLCYPSFYEVGMSNLGLRILYGQFNSYDTCVCERCFLPGKDHIAALAAQNLRLGSLESGTVLADFDVVGFNLGCELNAPDVLRMLEAGGLSLRPQERPHAIVMVGAMANPEPMADFVDVFFLGEFEETLEPFLDVLRRVPDKDSRLKALAAIPGFYVPRCHSIGSPIQRVWVKDLDKSFVPQTWLTPYAGIVHDRIGIEIARGCPNSCVFCQARKLYYPYRQRSPERVLEISRQLYRSSGYEDIAFLSLSASDYPQIGTLIDQALEYFGPRKVGISLPSLRLDDVLGPLYKKIIPLKKTSLTVAVESAGEGLRGRLNKGIDLKKLFEAAQVLRSLQINHLKIYFMFGFPQESDDDLLAIGALLRELRRASRMNLNVSINIFVPKPFSTWESALMPDEKELERRRGVIMTGIGRLPGLKLSIANTKTSILEAIISRAGREFGQAILEAYRRGAGAQETSDQFSWPVWEEALKVSGIDWRRYLDGSSTNFSWKFIE